MNPRPIELWKQSLPTVLLSQYRPTFQHVSKMSCGEDDEESDDDDFDIEDIDDSLYRAALGTRPDLPSDLGIEDEEEYEPVLSVFYASTEVDPDKRPSAEAVLRSLEEGSEESASAKSKTKKI